MKAKAEIPKIYLISNGEDGKEILTYLKSLGGKNKFYGASSYKYYRWTKNSFVKGDYAFIDTDGLICVSHYQPSYDYKLKKLP